MRMFPAVLWAAAVLACTMSITQADEVQPNLDSAVKAKVEAVLGKLKEKKTTTKPGTTLNLEFSFTQPTVITIPIPLAKSAVQLYRAMTTEKSKPTPKVATRPKRSFPTMSWQDQLATTGDYFTFRSPKCEQGPAASVTVSPPVCSPVRPALTARTEIFPSPPTAYSNYGTTRNSTGTTLAYPNPYVPSPNYRSPYARPVKTPTYKLKARREGSAESPYGTPVATRPRIHFFPAPSLAPITRHAISNQFQVKCRLLERTASRTTVLSEPQLIVTEGIQGKLQVGSRIVPVVIESKKTRRVIQVNNPGEQVIEEVTRNRIKLMTMGGIKFNVTVYQEKPGFVRLDAECEYSALEMGKNRAVHIQKTSSRIIQSVKLGKQIGIVMPKPIASTGVKSKKTDGAHLIVEITVSKINPGIPGRAVPSTEIPSKRATRPAFPKKVSYNPLNGAGTGSLIGSKSQPWKTVRPNRTKTYPAPIYQPPTATRHATKSQALQLVPPNRANRPDANRSTSEPQDGILGPLFEPTGGIQFRQAFVPMGRSLGHSSEDPRTSGYPWYLILDGYDTDGIIRP